MAIRSPICSVLGHVDHGKSSLLDAIRGSAIIDTEAGNITQAIGASIIPIETIFSVAGPLLEPLKGKVNVPGLLFIDTPGHAAFTSLRKRGGALADLAIVCIDINEGLKPQTLEAIEILKNARTPFIIAANKIDLMHGWTPVSSSFLASYAKQSPKFQELFESRIYDLVGKLYALGFEAERFDRVGDYTKQVAIVPVSAKTDVGIPEILMVLIGLAQKYLEKRLSITLDDASRGVILEVKEDRGYGTTIDVIVHDGVLRKSDTLLIPTMDRMIITKVKALLEPAPLAEMRDRRAAYTQTDVVFAATGVKISAQDLDGVVAGMPVISLASEDDPRFDEFISELDKQVSSVLTATERDGVIVKADTIGSLEAMIVLLKEKDIPIRRTSIGNISRKDVLEAASFCDQDPQFGCILGFNVSISEDALEQAKKSKVSLLTSDIIYKILDEHALFLGKVQKEQQRSSMLDITKPCRFRVLTGYVFRQSNPAIVGCLVDKGTLESGAQVMKNGAIIGRIKAIQKDKESVSEAKEGSRVAVSIEKATVGRNLFEDDVLYIAISEHEFRTYKVNKDILTSQEKEVLADVARIHREENSLWGV